jgi:hypothetical protein
MNLEAGYLLAATGKRRYLELATNLALSLRKRSHRPICLLTDPGMEIPATHRGFFDIVKRVIPNPNFKGVGSKLLIYKESPFNRTLFLDADILLFKDDIEERWQELRGREFAVEGEMFTSGKVHGRDTKYLMELLDIPYVVNLNSGLIYFEKCERASNIFDYARWLHLEELRELRVSYEFRPGEIADEPIIGVSMAKFSVQPLPIINKRRMLQALLPYSSQHYFNLEKGDFHFVYGSTIDNAEVVSGTFCHFCNLEPTFHYLACVHLLRQQARVPQMRFRIELLD